MKINTMVILSIFVLVLSMVPVGSQTTYEPVSESKLVLKDQVNQYNETNQDDAGTGQDAPNGRAYALNISLNTPYKGSIGDSLVIPPEQNDTDDYYYVMLDNEGYLKIDGNTQSPDEYYYLYVSVYNAAGGLIMNRKTSEEKPTYDLDAPILGSGKYYLVFDTYSELVNYTFSLSFAPQSLPSQNDADAGDDAGDSYSTAEYVEPNSTIHGTIGEGWLEKNTDARDILDYYRYRAVNEGLLEVTVKVDANGVDTDRIFFDMYNASDIIEFSLMEMIVPQGDQKSSGICLQEGAKYYFHINWLGTDLPMEYTITSTFTEGRPEICPNPANVPFPFLSFYTVAYLVVPLVIIRKAREK